MEILLYILAFFGAAFVIVAILIVFALCVAASVSDKQLEDWESQYQLDNED